MTAFWRGELSLGRAFWEFAVVYLGLFNLLTTFGAMGAIAADLPVLSVAIFLLPIPFAAVAIVGVWRSAERYDGDPKWAALARAAVLVWAGLMMAI